MGSQSVASGRPTWLLWKPLGRLESGERPTNENSVKLGNKKKRRSSTTATFLFVKEERKHLAVR